MKTTILVKANVNGMYRVSLGEFEVEGDIFDFHSLIIRTDVAGDMAEVLTAAIAEKRVSYVNVETTITREDS